MNRQLLKYGEPPVLYNEQLAVISAEQIRLHLNNKGYLNAEVDTTVEKKEKKANLTFDVTEMNPIGSDPSGIPFALPKPPSTIF